MISTVFSLIASIIAWSLRFAWAVGFGIWATIDCQSDFKSLVQDCIWLDVATGWGSAFGAAGAGWVDGDSSFTTSDWTGHRGDATTSLFDSEFTGQDSGFCCWGAEVWATLAATWVETDDWEICGTELLISCFSGLR